MASSDCTIATTMAGDSGRAGLQIAIEPLASAFFAGEPFEARITLTNVNVPGQAGGRGRSSVDRGHRGPASPQSAGPALQTGLDGLGRGRRRSHTPRHRLHQIGPKIEARETVLDEQPDEQESYSPQTAVTPRGKRDWRTHEGNGRKASSDGPAGTFDTQEMLRGLTAGRDHPFSNGSAAFRHPHARQVSLASMPASPQADRFPYYSDELSPRQSLSTISEADDPQYIDFANYDGAASRPKRHRPAPHIRQPSYLNAYGADSLGVGRSVSHHQDPPGTITVLWAHARFRGQFTPSSTYIPPDPLLPLRSLLLHQPLGSGSLNPADKPIASKRWSLSFGSGTIGHEQNPSLTGSLVGLAKGLVWSGQAGTLDDERRKVWETKALPVLESLRSLIGIDIQLKPGESQSFTYKMPLPVDLPPSFRGQALRFHYHLEVSVNVSQGGTAAEQEVKEYHAPVRIWPHLTPTAIPSHTYDILNPIMQRAESASVEQDKSVPSTQVSSRPGKKVPVDARIPDEIKQYARELTRDELSRTASPLPPAEAGSRPATLNGSPASTTEGPGNGRFKGPSHRFNLPCREVVDLLSRRSQTARVEVRHHGVEIAHFTLLKVIFRAGETITALVDFARTPRSPAILKFSARLQSTETLPDLLCPDQTAEKAPKGPQLRKVHAEDVLAVALNISRTTVALGVPAEATPSFPVNAANSDQVGGLTWHVVLSFLVSCDNTKKASAEHTMPSPAPNPDVSMTARPDLTDVKTDQALSPWPMPADSAERAGRIETVNCSIPVTVIPGNTMAETSIVTYAM